MSLSIECLILSLVVFVFASCFGSFFKLVIDRYDTNESIVFKSSYCLTCKKNLLWWHNIPVLNFLILGGKCYFCKTKIDINCIYSELITALVALVIFISSCNRNESPFKIVLLLVFSMILLLLSMFDLKHRVVPHAITYSAIIFVIISQCLFEKSFLPSLVNLAIAFVFMDMIHVFSTLIKKFNMDINLLSVPLIVWSICFFFYQNLYFIFIPTILYFLILKFEISKKLFIFSWILLFFLILFETYKIAIIDFDSEKLILFFAGIGIIYLICEIVFYYFDLFFPFKGIQKVNIKAGEKVTIGGGDITVFALISVFLGYKVAFLVLFIASLLAVLSHFTIRIITKLLNYPKERYSQYVPFIPYLTLACFIIIVTKW